MRRTVVVIAGFALLGLLLAVTPAEPTSATTPSYVVSVSADTYGPVPYGPYTRRQAVALFSRLRDRYEGTSVHVTFQGPVMWDRSDRDDWDFVADGGVP